MQISFYKTSDDPKTLLKTFEKIGTGEATLSVPVNNTNNTISLLHPTFIVASNSLYFTATHIYVSDMGNRYYYIGDPVLLTGGKIEIPCSVDALATYAAQIMQRPCTVIRYSHKGGKIATPTYIPDSKYPLDTTRYNVTAQNFSYTPFLTGAAALINPCYILTTMGGGT